MKTVWILTESAQAAPELCMAARTVGEKVTALVIGTQAEAERTIQLGADEAFWLGEANDIRMAEDFVETAAALLRNGTPNLLLVRASKRGRLIAGRLAALLGTAVLSDVKEFIPQESELAARHMLYGGGAVRTEKACGATSIAVLGSGAFQPAVADPSRKGTVTTVDFIAPACPVKLLERRIKTVSSVNLSAAKIVVGVGRGLAKQEDLNLVEGLAKALGAEVACSRPIAEGVNWLPRERYLGVSGAVIKPDLYLALGISGQVQHMVGVNDAKMIVAINKDKMAPIFAQSDYGIVGDLYKVIPLLMAAIEKLGK
jgi:electron transfer flavoprotein alpha subunit